MGYIEVKKKCVCVNRAVLADAGSGANISWVFYKLMNNLLELNNEMSMG